MRPRSHALVAVGALLLLASAALAGVLVHDGELPQTAWRASVPGDAVVVKGDPAPFHPDSLSAWAPWNGVLANHTYVLEPSPGLMALLTSADPLPEGVLVLEGDVLFRGPAPHPRHDDLLVLHVQRWREPLLFD